MVNTKTTPWQSSQEIYRCPVCGDRFPTAKEWSDHIITCCEEKRVSTSFICKEPACTYAALLERDLRRHSKRKHQKSTVAESDTDSDEIPFSQRPTGSSCVDITSVTPEVATSPELAPVRKPTKPLPVFGSTKKRQLMERLADGVVPVKVPRTTATAVRSNLLVAASITSPVLFTSPVAQTRVTSSLGGGVFLQPTCGLVVPAKRTIETQTPGVIAHHHLKRTVRTWYEEGVKVEETTEETWDN
ncbi:uncharacterized protein LOC134700415 [Mytilus trossulus]|uniref:uncharacterized protein LOC134700415 n=1 Tax=Mytilus trossulus TaxID=6551 RepID=UPI003004B5A1